MTEQRLQELKNLCAQATPGPWTYEHAEFDCERPFEKCLHGFSDMQDGCRDCEHIVVCNGAYIPQVLTLDDGTFDCMNDTDAAFIATSRAALPELIAENEHLQALVEAQREVIDAQEDFYNFNPLRDFSKMDTKKTVLDSALNKLENLEKMRHE